MGFKISKLMQDFLETTHYQDPETGEEVLDEAPAEDDDEGEEEEEEEEGEPEA